MKQVRLVTLPAYAGVLVFEADQELFVNLCCKHCPLLLELPAYAVSGNELMELIMDERLVTA